jgi:hypothetical protein
MQHTTFHYRFYLSMVALEGVLDICFTLGHLGYWPVTKGLWYLYSNIGTDDEVPEYLSQ